MTFFGKSWTRRRFLTRAGSAGLLVGTSPLRALMQTQTVGTESDRSATQTHYPAQWTEPPRSSVPAWAAPGKVRFARWDGGALEVVKAALSGWPAFSPLDPRYVDSMAGWYDPRTIELLQRAHINTIWVTFSNGFSNKTEHQQQETLRTYIAACHQVGIRTIAYESLTNMFFEDMFANVPDSKNWLSYGKDGKPVAYGAADYIRAGHVSRYLADLSNPAWQSYVRGRIDLAIDAGADGLMFDNCFGGGLQEIMAGLMQYALGRKKDFLMMANFHREQFTYNRMLNAITTEEGAEAGILTDEEIRTANNRWLRERDNMPAVDGGRLANNLGRLRVFANLSEGWKPFMIETRIRKQPGMAETHILGPQQQKLVMAENLAFNSAYEPSVEIAFAQGLWTKQPEAEAAWNAIASYNAFATAHELYYVGAQPYAALAILLDNRSDGVELLNALSGRNLQYEVLYEDQLTSAQLQRFVAVAAPTASMAGAAALAALKSFVERGGHLLVTNHFATADPSGHASVRPAWLESDAKRGSVVQWANLPSVDDLAAQLASAAGVSRIHVSAPPEMLYCVTRQPGAKRALVHLIHYRLHSTAQCVIEIAGIPGSVKVLSPDTAALKLRTTKTGTGVRLDVDGVSIYAVVVLENVTFDQ